MTEPLNQPSDIASVQHRLAAANAQLALVQRMMTLGTFDIAVAEDGSIRCAGDYLQLHGMPASHVDESYEDWLVRVHPHDRERAEKIVREAIAGTTETYEHEYRIVRPDNREMRWIRARAGIKRDAKGRVCNVVGVHIDITREKHIEEELRESRERLLMSLRTACMGTYEWLATERRMMLSPLSSDVFGLQPDQRVESADAFYALLHPDDRADYRRVLERAAADGTDFHIEFRIERPRDKRVAWIEEHGHGSRDPTSGQSRVRGVHWDITKRKRAEAALNESREQLRALIEGIPQLLWRSSPDGAWTWASSQWVSFTQVTAESSLGEGWLIAMHPDDRDRARLAWRRASVSGELRVDVRLMQAATQRYRWFQVTAMPTRNVDGEIVEWFGTCTDIEDQVQARRVLAQAGEELEKRVESRTRELRATMESLTREVQQRERVEERLRQSEKLKAVGQLTGGIAHDFNNMLQTISGSIGVIGILLQQGRTDEIEAYLERARRGVTRAAALTHRLLAFGRKQTLAPEPLSLDDVLQDMDELIRRTVGPEVNVELQLSDGAWLVLCDANQVESALLNLCVNARDAMPDGGWLTVATQERVLSNLDLADEEGVAPGRFCTIVVSDTGIGMSAEVLGRAYEPFFTTKPEGQGTGLGLSQIYGFVRQSGGFVRIESKPAAGTTVTLFFPYFSTRQGEEYITTEPCVLLVEDEAEVRDVTIEQFRAAKFRVIEAHNAEAAMRLLQSGTQLDILVSDVRLPGSMDGVQLAEMARKLRPALPVVLISGYADGRTLPGAPLIDKPFDFDVLLGHVRNLLHPLPPERRSA
jgi:PAS domain S-box-containing protein